LSTSERAGDTAGAFTSGGAMLGGPDLQRRFTALNVVTGLTLGFTAPLTAVLAIQLGASPFTAGLLVASLTGTVFVLDLIGTRWLPFLEPRRSIMLGMLLWAVGSFVTALAPDVAVMTAARVGQGLGLALQAAAAPQLAVKMGGAGRVGAAIGRFQAAMTFGSSVAPLTGGAVAAVGIGTFGPRLAFGVCGILALLCAAGAWLILPTLPSRTRPRLGLPRLPGMWHPRALLAVGVGATGQGTRGALALTIIPIVAAERLGISGSLIGVYLTSMYLVEVVTMALVGGWSDRHGRRPTVLVGTVAGMLGCLVLAAAGWAGSSWLLFGAALSLGVAGGCMLSLLPAVLVDLSGGPEVGLAATRISRDLGFTAFTVLAGATISFGGTTAALALATGLFVVVAVGIVVVGETGPSSRASHPVGRSPRGTVRSDAAAPADG
jgi:DHA1 family inner membrane transport protein